MIPCTKVIITLITCNNYNFKFPRVQWLHLAAMVDKFITSADVVSLRFRLPKINEISSFFAELLDNLKGVITFLAASFSVRRKWLLVHYCRLSHLSVCRSVSVSVGWLIQKVYCGRTADWIRMPFGVVSGVS